MTPSAPTDRDALRLGSNSAASLVAQGTRFALYFATAIVLARLLSPSDFGVFGVAFAVTGFLEIAKDGGLVVPVVQSASLSQAQLSALFRLNLGLGAALTVVSWAAAPAVAAWYGEPRLTPLIRTLAVVFLVGGASTQHRALLRRQARFVALGVCETTALAAGCAAAVFAAMRGAGAWSLVWMYVTLETAQSALTVAASRWRPDLRAGGGAAVAPLLRFGGMMMAFDFLGYVNLKLDNLIVAWYLGPAALGYYDKAYQFLLLPVNQIGMPISSVAHTALSRSRAALDHYRAAFDRLLLLNAGLGMPVTAFLAVNTSAVVALVLGEKWTPSVPIFHALAPAALLMTVTTCVGWIFLSLGRAGRQLRWGALLTAATLAAYFVGVRWGAVGVAAGVSAVRIALFLPTLVYTCAGSPIGVGQILRVVSLPALASAAAMAASLAADRWLGPGAWALPRNAALFCAAYALVWMAAPSGRAALAGLPLFAKIPVER